MHPRAHHLDAAAARVYRSKARVCGLFSGRRFGKTRFMLTEASATALEQPGGQIFYLAPRCTMAKVIAWSDLKRVVPARWIDRAMESTHLLAQSPFPGLVHQYCFDSG